MPRLVDRIITDFTGQVTFQAGDQFLWSPHSHSVQYEEPALEQPQGIWSLLHEIGHAQLGHQAYRSDLHLLMMEVAAWRTARELAKRYEVEIDEHYIENCLESYRIWLHERSRCLDCKTNALQADETTYCCHNCLMSWKVPKSRLCQVRRQRI